MKCVIAISTHHTSLAYCCDLLTSLRGVRYPVYVTINDASAYSMAQMAKLHAAIMMANAHYWDCLSDGYEIGALESTHRLTKADEIFLLQDTTMVKDLTMFDVAFSERCSFTLGNNFQMYLGKFRREILSQVPFPRVQCKRQAVWAEGAGFCWPYSNAEVNGVKQLGTMLCDTELFVERHGQTRMQMENEYIIKWKGTWLAEQIPTDWPEGVPVPPGAP
jgi:hypothetical protein